MPAYVDVGALLVENEWLLMLRVGGLLLENEWQLQLMTEGVLKVKHKMKVFVGSVI